MSVESPYLYSSTTGMHNTHLERYRALGAKKSRTTDEEKEYKHHKSQLKFYRALRLFIIALTSGILFFAFGFLLGIE